MASRQLALPLRRLSQLSRATSSPLIVTPGRLPLLTRERPQGVRFNSTQSSGAGPSASSRTTPLIFALGAALGVGLTYYATSSSPPSSKKKSQIYHTAAGLNEEYGTPEDFQKAIVELRTTFPQDGYVSTDGDDLHLHGFSDNDYHPGMSICRARRGIFALIVSLGSTPTVVVYPTSTEDVVKIVNISRKYRMPIIAYSGATSLEGHYRAVSIVIAAS